MRYIIILLILMCVGCEVKLLPTYSETTIKTFKKVFEIGYQCGQSPTQLDKDKNWQKIKDVLEDK